MQQCALLGLDFMLCISNHAGMTNPLAAYLDRNGIKPGTFARLAGLQRPTVYRMYKGQSRPSLRMAGIIERATGGAVPLSSWVKPSRAA